MPLNRWGLAMDSLQAMLLIVIGTAVLMTFACTPWRSISEGLTRSLAVTRAWRLSPASLSSARLPFCLLLKSRAICDDRLICRCAQL